MTVTHEELDSILNAANEGFGLIIRTTNAYQLSIALRGRISAQRKLIHPQLYANLMILSSKSPLELYLINKEKARAYHQGQGNVGTPDQHREPGLPAAEGDVPSERHDEPGGTNTDQPPRGEAES